MAEACVINVDLADIWAEKGRKKFLRTLSWGDQVSVISRSATALEVGLTTYHESPDGSILPEVTTGFIEPPKSSGIKPADTVVPRNANRVLSVNFVDVQQGDGAVIETPAGKVMLVDGGDNQLFARYLAGRFRGTTLGRPQPVECILVTHGDADHFVGLTEIFHSETHPERRKRIFIQPKRVYHNGIVKRPSSRNGKRVADRDLLGPTRKVDKDLFLVGLEDNLLKVDDAEMNQPFRKWKEALAAYNKREKVKISRLQFGDDEAFDFFADEGLASRFSGRSSPRSPASRRSSFSATHRRGRASVTSR